jgi:hypothetical protein
MSPLRNKAKKCYYLPRYETVAEEQKVAGYNFFPLSVCRISTTLARNVADFFLFLDFLKTNQGLKEKSNHGRYRPLES